MYRKQDALVLGTEEAELLCGYQGGKVLLQHFRYKTINYLMLDQDAGWTLICQSDRSQGKSTSSVWKFLLFSPGCLVFLIINSWYKFK